MKLLVTACNKLDNEQLADPGVFLYQVDTATDQILAIDVGLSAMDKGITGLAKHREGWTIIAQNDLKRALQKKPHRLLYLDHSLRLQRQQELNLVSDPHSLLNVDDGCLIASTGTDTIVKLANNGEEEVFWQISDKNSDSCHLNSLARLGGEVFVSAFGPKQAELHSSATQGYVRAIDADSPAIENIYHPHSLRIFDQEFFLCGSGDGKIYQNDKVLLHKSSGYLRGLALNKHHLVVGVSKQRKKSKSLNRMAYHPAPEKVGTCELLIYNRSEQDLVFEKAIAMHNVTDEIYDIEIIEA